jgi:hypothetical protein
MAAAFGSVAGLRLIVSSEVGQSCPELLTADLQRSRA